MKKTPLVILAALLLFTTACSSGMGPNESPTDIAYHPETDSPYSFNNRALYCTIAQVETGYYFFLENMLMYAEDDIMEPIPVCAKPNCLHHESKKKEDMANCNAFFFATIASDVFYYDSELYVFHRWYPTTSLFDPSEYRMCLTRISPDGSRRQTILELDFGVIGETILHRGVFYLATQSVNEQGKTLGQLWAYPLHEPKQEPKLLYQTEELDFTHNVFTHMYAYGNYLYLGEYLTANHHGSVYNAYQLRSLRILDLTTDEWIVSEVPEGYTFGGSAIAGGKLVREYTPIGVTNALAADGTKPDLAGPLLISDLDGSNVEQISFQAWGRMSADESYIYIQDPIYSADGKTSVMNDSLRFYDCQMNPVDELPLDKLAYNEKLITLTVFATQGEKILLHATHGGENSTNTLYYINRSEIGSGNITPKLFHRYSSRAYSIANRNG